MKLYGSLNNRVEENTLQRVPEVMMGATLSLYSDQHAYTIREVSKETITVEINTVEGVVKRTYPKWIKASRDKATIINGESVLGSPEYKFELTDKIRKFIFHKLTGLYREEKTKLVGLDENGNLNYEGTGRTTKDSSPLLIGYKREYWDPSF